MVLLRIIFRTCCKRYNPVITHLTHYMLPREGEISLLPDKSSRLAVSSIKKNFERLIDLHSQQELRHWYRCLDTGVQFTGKIFMIDQLLDGNKRFSDTVFKQNFDPIPGTGKRTEPSRALDRVFGFTSSDRPYNADANPGTCSSSAISEISLRSMTGILPRCWSMRSSI